MKWLMFRHNDQTQVGFLTGDQVVPFDRCPDLLSVIKQYSVAQLLELEQSSARQSFPIEQVEVLTPIQHPVRNIFSLGMNYKDHIAELGASQPEKPIYFTKTGPTVGHLERVRYPQMTRQLDYEVELAIVIGRAGRDLTPENALEHVFGYTIANDLSARDIQFERSQWFRAKSFDGCCPLGPVILLNQTNQEPDWAISSEVNGEIRQQSRTSQLLLSVSDILVDLSQDLTLLPGDIILTGTPSGVGMGFDPPRYLQPGDVVRCSIDPIGHLDTIISHDES